MVSTADAIHAAIARIDARLSEQINLILHHEEFQALESSWRGLHYLVSHTESNALLKIRVLDVSRPDLAKVLRRYKGTSWDQSPIYGHIHVAEDGGQDAEPYACLVGDYYFDQSSQDGEILGEMALIAAAAHAPFIAGASPYLCQMASWQELQNPRDLAKIFSTPEYSAWRAFREWQGSRYVCLTLPRFLARCPYGPPMQPVGAFSFHEDTGALDHARFCWVNSSYAMAANISRAITLYGWCARIRGFEAGGAVEGLPGATFLDDDGGLSAKCPTEIEISERRERELARLGLAALVHRAHTDMAAFVSAPSLQKAVEYNDPDATQRAHLSVRFPYVLAACRFALYLECIAREKDDAWPSDLQNRLQAWVNGYVDTDPRHSSDLAKARRPLAGAQVEVVGTPGAAYYRATFSLTPHYQLEGPTDPFKVVVRLPSGRSTAALTQG